jgi:hypothetical protein
MSGGKVVLGVLLVVFGWPLFRLSDILSVFSTVGSSAERALYLFGVTNCFDFFMQAINDVDYGAEDDVDKLRLFLFLFSLFLLIIWLLIILIEDTVSGAISPILSMSKGRRV